MIPQRSKNAKIFLTVLFKSLAIGTIAGICARLSVFPIISLLHILFKIESADSAYFWIGKIVGELTFVIVMYKSLRDHNWSKFTNILAITISMISLFMLGRILYSILDYILGQA